jgi:predicted membrane protein
MQVSVGKKKQDKLLGHLLNITISGLFMIIFIFVAACANKKGIVVTFINMWLSIADPFDAALNKEQPSVFIFS